MTRTTVTIFCSTIPERERLLGRSVESWIESANQAGCMWSAAIYAEGYEHKACLPEYANFSIDTSPNRTGSPEVGSNFLWKKHEWHTDVAIFTHPEIMFSRDLVKQAIDNAKDNTYVTFRPFWMPRYLTDHYEEYGFDCPEAMENCEDLYQYGPDPNGAQKYLNVGVRESRDWQSDTTWSGNKQTISQLFPVPEFGAWGPIDPYLAGARLRLGHQRIVPDACVYHQDHERIQGGPPGYAVEKASRALRERFG